MLAANLHMISSYWGDANGNPLSSVAVGTQPNLWVNYNVEGIPAGFPHALLLRAGRVVAIVAALRPGPSGRSRAWWNRIEATGAAVAGRGTG